MNDLISRRAAIDAIRNQAIHTPEALNDIGIAYYEGLHYAFQVISMLPSAEPEIIYCGDCKYKDDGIDEDGIPFLKCLNGRSYGGTRINDYCSWAERRTDE